MLLAAVFLPEPLSPKNNVNNNPPAALPLPPQTPIRCNDIPLDLLRLTNLTGTKKYEHSQCIYAKPPDCYDRPFPALRGRAPHFWG